MFYKKVDTSSNKEMFEFLKDHFEYDTMNSWNGLRSIANNVKLYNLGLDDYEEAYRALEEDDWFMVNQFIKDWEEAHPGYEVNFNGRSGGYLVLTAEKNNHHVFGSDSYSPVQYYDYESWKEDVQEGWGSLKAYQPSLLKQVRLVQDFDKLCDDLIEVVKECIKSMEERESKTHHFKCTKRFVRYYYDTIEDLKYHMEYMKQAGCSVWEYSEEDLYAEYEMNDTEEGDVYIE